MLFGIYSMFPCACIRLHLFMAKLYILNKRFILGQNVDQMLIFELRHCWHIFLPKNIKLKYDIEMLHIVIHYFSLVCI